MKTLALVLTLLAALLLAGCGGDGGELAGGGAPSYMVESRKSDGAGMENLTIRTSETDKAVQIAQDAAEADLSYAEIQTQQGQPVANVWTATSDRGYEMLKAYLPPRAPKYEGAPYTAMLREGKIEFDYAT